jgi:choline dehydrogenase-like flavoprotein
LRLAPDGRLAATVTANPATNAVMAGAAAALARPFRRAGLWPLRMALRHGAPASSFHAGGTLPMAATPGPGRTDVAGRPFGLSRVHVADASVLPEIPATTITLAVMANAHRIACL